MRRQHIPAGLRRHVADRANGLCEYCRSPELTSPQPFIVEHIVPHAAGGPTHLDNLALACPGCNGHKYTKTRAADPVSGDEVPLFNPRQSDWSDHFRWAAGFERLLGITPTGRATVEALCLNRPSLVRLRTELARVGLHPPAEESS